MGFADHARTLLGYNRWANEKLLDAAAGLPWEDATRAGGASFGSVAGNLQHIIYAQVVWLSRWHGAPSMPELPNMDGRDQLAAAFVASHKDLDAFATALTDADWDRMIEFTDTRGAAHADPLGRLITHLVNHGTLHRGEAGMLLASLDRSPGDLDYHYYCREAGR
jgi:uncharacterized damage-inducible protein DinB